MTDARRNENPPEGWPECEDEQVRVMLLGTYHMDNPGLDEVNTEADDVLAADRQAQLRELVDRLEPWKPDRVAVERPWDEREAVNEIYGKYRSGEYAYDREEIFPAPHPMRNDDDTECRSEVVQVGFRLADRLDHDRVFPIDEHPEESQYNPDPFEVRGIDSTRKTSTTLSDAQTRKRESDERLDSSSIPEYFAWINDESRLRYNHEVLFDRGIRATGEEFGSPIALTYWYDRNIRMVHHLWQAVETGDDRLLFIVGSGHICVLRHLLDEAPMFCPTSPLPLLR